jgi:hypothetical protein
VCVCVQNPDLSFGLVFFQSIDFDFFCLKVKVKVGLLKLTLKLVFPHKSSAARRLYGVATLVTVTFGENPDPSFGVFFFSRAFDFEFFVVLKLKLKLIC